MTAAVHGIFNGPCDVAAIMDEQHAPRAANGYEPRLRCDPRHGTHRTPAYDHTSGCRPVSRMLVTSLRHPGAFKGIYRSGSSLDNIPRLVKNKGIRLPSRVVSISSVQMTNLDSFALPRPAWRGNEFPGGHYLHQFLRPIERQGATKSLIQETRSER